MTYLKVTCSLSCLLPTVSGSGQTAQGTKDEAQPLKQLTLMVDFLTWLSRVALSASPVQGEAPRSSEGEKVQLQMQGKLLQGQKCQSSLEGLDDLLPYLII